MSSEVRALRRRVKQIEEEIARLTDRRERLVAAIQVLEEDDRLPAPRSAPAGIRTEQPERVKRGRHKLPEVIVDVVREREGQAASEITTEVVRRAGHWIKSADPRRVVSTRIGQLVRSERLIRDDERRLFLPEPTLLLNGKAERAE